LILEQKAIESMDASEKKVADLFIGKPLDMNRVVTQISEVLMAGTRLH
jgi:hypothetical protein